MDTNKDYYAVCGVLSTVGDAVVWPQRRFTGPRNIDLHGALGNTKQEVKMVGPEGLKLVDKSLNRCGKLRSRQIVTV